MKKFAIKNNILEKHMKSEYVLLFLPVLILIGKFVRWTIMRGTLVGFSKGWGYVYPIIGGVKIPFQLFTAENALDGEVGGVNNMYLFYRFIWNLCLRIPRDFYDFEIMFTLIFTLVLVIIFSKLKKTLQMPEFLFICISIMVLNVYCFALAKEPMQMFYFVALFYVLYTDKIPDNRKMQAGAIVVVLMAMTFRIYYVIFLVFAFPFKYFMEKIQYKKITPFELVKLFLKMCAVYLVMMLILRVTSGGLYFRLSDCLLHASAATASSNTYIENVITQSSGNPIMVAIEYSVVVLRLLCPIELISLGPKYWPYIAYQVIMTILMIRAIINYNLSDKIQRIATILFVGFVFGSSTFEVDFGAWVRHGAVTLPLILLMTGMIKAESVTKRSGYMRVLVTGFTDNYGGVETFLMNYCREMKKLNPKLIFDIVSTSPEPAFKEEFEAMGGVAHKISRTRKTSSQRKELTKIMTNTHYDVLWCNKCELSNIVFLKIATKCGIQKRILHSHNSDNMYDGVKRMAIGYLHNFNKKKAEELATDLWACSDVAAKWMFLTDEYSFVPNAVNMDTFKYDVEKRNFYREELNISDKLVVGTVGRFSYQKNPGFLLDIFKEIHEKRPNSVLIWVGTGELQDSIKAKIKEYDLEDSVMLLGRRHDVNDLMQAMDCFLLPSRFEGLPVVAIEAQAVGLTVFAAKDGITEQTKITDNLHFMSLSQTAKEWAYEVLMEDLEHKDNYEQIVESGFEIKTASEKLLERLGE